MRLSRVAPAVRTILGKRARMCTPYPVHAAEEGMRNKALENTLTRLFRGCMKLALAARGSQEAGHTQPLREKFAQLSTLA